MFQVTPNLHIPGHCKEAIRLYEKVFDAQVRILLCNSDVSPADSQAEAGQEDLVYHAEMQIGGQRILLSDQLDAFPPQGNTASLLVTFDTSSEVRAVYSQLS